jgi:hypothetical protein
MATFKFGTAAIWASLGALAFVLLAQPAKSRPGAPTTDPLLQRVALLEDRTHFLQRQVDALQQQVNSLQRNTTTKTLEAGGWIDPYETDCANPYTVDSAGIRRVKAECARIDNCKPPYSLSADGIKKLDAACLEQASATASATDCDPPFSVDAQGVKHFRPECFDGMKTR